MIGGEPDAGPAEVDARLGCFDPGHAVYWYVGGGDSKLEG